MNFGTPKVGRSGFCTGMNRTAKRCKQVLQERAPNSVRPLPKDASPGRRPKRVRRRWRSSWLITRRRPTAWRLRREVRMARDLLLAGGRVLDPSQSLNAVLDIGLRDGRIHEIGRALDR